MPYIWSGGWRRSGPPSPWAQGVARVGGVRHTEAGSFALGQKSGRAEGTIRRSLAHPAWRGVRAGAIFLFLYFSFSFFIFIKKILVVSTDSSTRCSWSWLLVSVSKYQFKNRYLSPSPIEAYGHSSDNNPYHVIVVLLCKPLTNRNHI